MNLKVYIYNSYLDSGGNARYNAIFNTHLIQQLELFGNYVENEWVVSYPEFDSPFCPISHLHEMFEDYEFSDKTVLCNDMFIIQNMDNKKFILIDIQDGPSLSYYILPHENCVGVIDTFYDQHWLQTNVDKHHLVTPGHYFPMEPDIIESDEMYEKISSIKPTDKRLFFSGTIGHEVGYQKSDGTPRREVAIILKEKYPDDVRVLSRFEKLPRYEWWKEAAKHYINLSLPGHPWCNREHELWALGLPILASEWVNPTIHSPRPNYHYLSADGGPREHTGTCLDAEYAADKLYERYKLSINEPEYLKWIGNNGRKYYLDYITPSESSKYYAETISNWALLK